MGSFYYREMIDTVENKRIIYTTRCPNHYSICQTEECMIADAARDDNIDDGITMGTSAAIPSEGYWELPLFPMMALNLAGNTNTTCWESEVGIALNGVSFYSQATDTDTCDDALHTDSHSRSIDMCGGSADKDGVYNYKMQPSCLLEQLGNVASEHAQQIGWALDGFPIYGGTGPDGTIMEPCTNFIGTYGDAEGIWLSAQTTKPAYCLDECNGLFAPLDGVDEYQYRYYVTGPQASGSSVCDSNAQYACDRTDAQGCCIDPVSIPATILSPYTIGCFKGCQLLDFDCFAQSNFTGTTDSFVPNTAKGPTDVYSSDISTTQFKIDIATGDTGKHLPHEVWDSFSTDETDVPYAVTSLVAGGGTYSEPILRQGDIAYMAVTFSEAIAVEGTPTLSLTHVETNPFTGETMETTIYAAYSYLSSTTTAMFEIDLDPSESPVGTIKCNADSSLLLNGGRLLRAANFMPVVVTDLSLRTVCCYEGECATVAHIESGTPVVSRVYSPMTGTLVTPETLLVNVEFDKPVYTVGTPYLRLDLDSYPSMEFISMTDLYTLSFRYVVKAEDASSRIDYLNATSLYFETNDTETVSGNTIGRGPGLYDGVLARGVYSRILADLTLPERGSVNSLGYTSSLAIDNLRESFVAISAVPTQATGGDVITFTVQYSAEMKALSPEGASLFDNSHSSDVLASNIAAKHIGLAFTIVNSTSLRQECVAYIASVSGDDITFTYSVGSSDISGAVKVTDTSPFVLSTNDNGDTSSIVTASTHTPGPLTFTRAMIVDAVGTIDNDVPYVIDVSSPNSSITYPFGVGDVIDIYVAMSHSVVAVAEDMPALYFDFNASGIARTADFVGEASSSVSYSTLHFQYTVVDGDYAVPLEYINNTALMGTLLRYSTTSPILAANLTLPGIFSYGSLGFCCNVQIDTTAPIIESLIPVKHSGVYGENEQIVIVARFNKPVVVTGHPLLLLKVIDPEVLSVSADAVFNASLPRASQEWEWDGVGFANYTPGFTSYDVALNFDEADVLFTYIVNRHDSVQALEHLDSASFHCVDDMNDAYAPGCSVKHLTTNPTVLADLTLREPEDITEVNGRVLQQWKFRYPKRVEVLIRDLYHSQADSLNVRVEHSIKKSRLLSGDRNTPVLRKKTFGRPYPRTRSNSNATDWMADNDAGIGFTYMFSDTNQENIARKGSVEQSGSQSDPRRAIDGNIDPLLGHNSVSESSFGLNSWWQILLPQGSSVSDINIYPRVGQMWVEPIVSVTIKALDRLPQGNFKLTVSNYDTEDPSASITTDELAFGIDDSGLKAALQSLNIFGVVTVSRVTLTPCSASGCGETTENGYGHTYRVTFMNVLTSSPSITIVNETFLGGPVTNGATNEVTNELSFAMASHAELARSGQYIESKVTDGSGSNEWLTPFYVMLFDNRPTGGASNTDLTEALKQASYSTYIESIDTMTTISLPAPRATSFVRIQRVGYGSLALAEVEVFQERLNLMSSYAAGNPVAASTVMGPYQPQE